MASAGTTNKGLLPERTATKLLLAQRLSALKIEVPKLRFDRNIRFDTVQHFCTVTQTTLQRLEKSRDIRDGLTLIRQIGDRIYYIVLYNAAVTDTRRRNFTLAHEIGHILLEHTDDGDRQEWEADRFAAQLLLPRVLVEQLVRLWEGTLSAADLSGIFGVSQSAARRCLYSLQTPVVYTDDDHALLARFGGLLTGPEEPIVTF